jgi:hypothetical protein
MRFVRVASRWSCLRNVHVVNGGADVILSRRNRGAVGWVERWRTTKDLRTKKPVSRGGAEARRGERGCEKRADLFTASESPERRGGGRVERRRTAKDLPRLMRDRLAKRRCVDLFGRSLSLSQLLLMTPMKNQSLASRAAGSSQLQPRSFPADPSPSSTAPTQPPAPAVPAAQDDGRSTGGFSVPCRA